MFIQILELTTRRLPEIEALAARWAERTAGRRTALRTTTVRHLDRPDTYLVIVEFPDRAAAQANSDLPETGEFANELAALADGEIGFRDLDVVGVVDHAAGNRRTIDCRDTPNEVGCTLAISGEPDEVLEAAVQHAVHVHGHHDSAELRSMLAAGLRA